MPRLRNSLVLPVAFSFILTMATFAYAVESTSASLSVTKARTAQQLLEERKAVLEEKKNQIKDTAEQKKAALEEKKNQIKNLAEQKKASIEAKRGEIKDKLAAVRDEKKKALIVRIGEKLANINKNRTDHLLKILTRLEEIVKKIETRTAEVKGKGIDTSVVDAAVATAKTSIANAQVAVTAQAAKVYTITVNSETTAKNEVGQFMKGLEADLKTVRDLVKAAQESVMRAAVALKGLRVPVTVTPKVTTTIAPVPTE